MEYARLGETGLKVSRICLGCMGFGDASRWHHKWCSTRKTRGPLFKRRLIWALISLILPMCIPLEQVKNSLDGH